MASCNFVYFYINFSMKSYAFQNINNSNNKKKVYFCTIRFIKMYNFIFMSSLLIKLEDTEGGGNDLTYI